LHYKTGRPNLIAQRDIYTRWPNTFSHATQTIDPGESPRTDPPAPARRSGAEHCQERAGGDQRGGHRHSGGYTRGAFYSNFNSKGGLFVELLRLDHQNIREQLQKLLVAASTEGVHKQLTSLYAQCYRDDNHYVIWAEARLHAMRNAKFRERMNALCLEKRDLIASFIEQFCKRANVQLPSSSAHHALATIALLDGVLYFAMTMPDERWLFSMSQGISPTIESHAEEIDLFGPLVRRQVFSASSISLNARPSKVGTAANVDSIALATGMI
jgi:AcrR family transcriptional regulator